MIPTREEAERLLLDAEKCNFGSWINHSRIAAYCAEKIAFNCKDLNSDKAYILGLLHDIGRKFGISHFKHIMDGYEYMMSLGYDEVAKICLTHSFNNQNIDEYIGKFDVSEIELNFMKNLLLNNKMDDYDRLIQLCDCLAGSKGVLDIEERMTDIKSRYGFYPMNKWNKNIELKRYFENKTNKNIYEILDIMG